MSIKLLIIVLTVCGTCAQSFAADIATINGVPIGNVASFNGVAKANIASINGLTIASAGYAPNTAYFAGDAQCYLQHSSPWAGGANSLAFSFWIKPDGAAGTTDYIFGAGDDGIRIRINTADQILFTCEDAASTVLVSATSTATITRNAATWTHVFIRLDRAVEG